MKLLIAIYSVGSLPTNVGPMIALTFSTSCLLHLLPSFIVPMAVDSLLVDSLLLILDRSFLLEIVGHVDDDFGLNMVSLQTQYQGRVSRLKMTCPTCGCSGIVNLNSWSGPQNIPNKTRTQIAEMEISVFKPIPFNATWHLSQVGLFFLLPKWHLPQAFVCTSPTRL
ncbi:hypothetical protein QYF36_018158 [Acer negundo]|nr:hypothetical protein QYF36_018158 [Acer negundo]